MGKCPRKLWEKGVRWMGGGGGPKEAEGVGGLEESDGGRGQIRESGVGKGTRRGPLFMPGDHTRICSKGRGPVPSP